jgi:hypothetical protein
MDLESTLIRAEALFQRFQRTVELIDKKDNFPSAPQARQRKSIASPPTSSGPSGSTPQASASGVDKGKQVESDEDKRVISPELRSLLSRKVEIVAKEDIVKQGGGVGGGR